MKTPLAAALCLTAFASHAQTPIPASSGTALDGHTITLPRDLSAPATVLILGFTRSSPDATTAWEKSVRISLAATPSIRYLDIAFLEDVPSLMRPLILRSLRHYVPDRVKPCFLPLTAQEALWKQIAGFSSNDPNAAYILLVDPSGRVHWQTHLPLTPDRFNELAAAARQLAATGR